MAQCHADATHEGSPLLCFHFTVKVRMYMSLCLHVIAGFTHTQEDKEKLNNIKQYLCENNISFKQWIEQKLEIHYFTDKSGSSMHSFIMIMLFQILL